jgi:hypothetical protein
MHAHLGKWRSVQLSRSRQKVEEAFASDQSFGLALLHPPHCPRGGRLSALVFRMASPPGEDIGTNLHSARKKAGSQTPVDVSMSGVSCSRVSFLLFSPRIRSPRMNLLLNT